jgi:hypothetical protein
MPKIAISEAEVKTAVQDYLNALKKQGKLDWIRLNAGKIQTINKSWIHLGEEGLPDLLVIANGRAFGLELKKPTGKHREEQEETKKRWELLSINYTFVHSFEEAKHIIDLYI